MHRSTSWLAGGLVLAMAACTAEEASMGDGSADETADPQSDPPSSSADDAAQTSSTPGDDGNGTGNDGSDAGAATTQGPAATTAPGDTSTDGGSDGVGGETGEPVGCYDYDAFVPFAVRYRDDVMPILAARCSSCHPDPTASVYFGMGGTTEAEATAIYDKLLQGEPKQAPHLQFVVPGDALRSYMMAKLEYDDPGGTCSLIQCAEPGCELQAPPSAQLPEGELAIVRSWILGGALDD